MDSVAKVKITDMQERYRSGVPKFWQTAIWEDRLTDSEYHRAGAYKMEPVPGQEGQWFACIALDINMCLEDICTLGHDLTTSHGSATGIVVERGRVNCLVQPLLGATMKPTPCA